MEEEKQGPQERTTETNIEERWRMIGYWECCSYQTQTATYFQVSQSAISKTINKLKLTGNMEDFSRSGRPSVQSSHIEDSITDMVYQNKYVSAQEIALELDLSRSTTFLSMKNMGLKYSVPSQIPQLNKSHIAKRLKYAEENKNTDIKNIIFTDESYFYLHRNNEGCCILKMIIILLLFQSNKYHLWCGQVQIGLTELKFAQKKVDILV